MKQGRPRELQPPTQVLTCVVGADLVKQLDQLLLSSERTQSEIIRAALYSYLEKSTSTEV
jgi:predicted transcriptional regulator